MSWFTAGRKHFPATAAAIALELIVCNASAQSQPALEWTAGADVTHRRLTERSASGAKLLTEKGAIGRLSIAAQPTSPRWSAWQLQGAYATGRLDYEGQTQAGAPLSTTTRHSEGELGAQWRALATPAWGEWRFGLHYLRQRRAVVPTLTIGGITETSSLLLPGIAWRSPQFAVGGFNVQADARVRTSVLHRLDVDYHGVFDGSSLDGGRRDEASLNLSTPLANRWSASLAWTHSRQAASDSVQLFRGGAPVGTVRQPELRIDDLSLRMTRSF